MYISRHAGIVRSLVNSRLIRRVITSQPQNGREKRLCFPPGFTSVGGGCRAWSGKVQRFPLLGNRAGIPHLPGCSQPQSQPLTVLTAHQTFRATSTMRVRANAINVFAMHAYCTLDSTAVV